MLTLDHQHKKIDGPSVYWEKYFTDYGSPINSATIRKRKSGRSAYPTYMWKN